MSTTNEDDETLLSKIESLENELAEKNKEIERLSGPLRVTKFFTDIWDWWFRDEMRIAITTLSIPFFLVIWLAAGWQTERFYVTDKPLGSSEEKAIYQEYLIGKDRFVTSCGTSLKACLKELDKQKKLWNENKDVID